MREEILAMLEKDSKIDPKDISAMLGVSEIDVVNELAKMEEEKIICGYHTLINWDNTSRDIVTALIELRVTPARGEGFDKIASRIYKFPQVKSLYLMSGGFDLTVFVEGKTMKEVALFVSEKLSCMDAVISTSTHFVLKKYKDHGSVLVKDKKSERMVITP